MKQFFPVINSTRYSVTRWNVTALLEIINESVLAQPRCNPMKSNSPSLVYLIIRHKKSTSMANFVTVRYRRLHLTFLSAAWPWVQYDKMYYLLAYGTNFPLFMLSGVDKLFSPDNIFSCRSLYSIIESFANVSMRYNMTSLTSLPLRKMYAFPLSYKCITM